METAALIQTLNGIAPLSAALQQSIVEMLREDKPGKKQLLLKIGQVNRRIYFIQKGFARAFYLNEDKEYTTWFMGPGDMMISVYSFFTQQPATESIEILEESVLLSITWQQMQTLYQNFPEFNLIGRIITEQYYIKSEARAIALRTLSAQERYQSLIKTYPDVIQKASLRQIASHLGISQETLSRIRAKK
ncbi:Crp/Fnr family transcriptional regulator [Mucilaginibacter paludis]|uniref:Transcriptional regulator, Crp/Fnr family n=1 Tax=Mucilaginibacter paludis DSM 18603 TaxID=714943 RepID=H1YFY0_9SPHI|nr:Crp/Fnr family transcriptional regulator [Mucilaginibacter paludis]EHQ26268.1 putative transcriptional regulator, Crp/Fnr family [Mucilaginibacter paludis DSM 18603]